MLHNYIKGGKKLNIKLIAIGIILLFFIGSFASADIINLKDPPQQSTRSNILYVGGNGNGNYTKIQDAIDNASIGDTIFVKDDSSPYIEHVFINKSINLIGENKHTTIIEWHNSFDFVIVIRADDIIIRDFTIINSATEFSVGCISLASNNTLIEDNIIEALYANCISSRGYAENTILNNEISSRIWIETSSNIVINGNTINAISVSSGINLRHVTNTRIDYNNILNGKWGLEQYNCKNNIITSNNFIGNEKHVSQTLSRRNYYDRNYWEQWIGNRFNFPIFKLFPYIFFNGGISIDWHPAKDPYGI